MSEKELYLALSLDVEEEGLFCGRYQTRRPPVSNALSLRRLEPFYERGVIPTLFCAHSVLTDSRAKQSLEKALASGVEIGAHLHHWNTPPLSPDSPDSIANVSAANLPHYLARAKLATLFAAINNFQGKPATSFRMGRWDLRGPHWPLLAEAGVLVDASVRPLHAFASAKAGPDHFHAPLAPYKVATDKGEILEIPLTVAPVVPMLTRMKITRYNLKSWGCLPLLPVCHPLWLLKLATRLFFANGGRVVSLTWHSSEMHPGGAPYMKTEATINKFLNKMTAYVDWLLDTYPVTPARASELLQKFADAPTVAGEEDWTWGAAS